MVLGLAVWAYLSKEVCSYEGADWLKLICQSEGGERSVAAHMALIVSLQIGDCIAEYNTLLRCNWELKYKTSYIQTAIAPI